MSETGTVRGRRRPAAAHGPARDVTRDARIIEATLDLLAERGYADLTMDGVAARAEVGKATVYRRWASREDLVADALETLDLAVDPADVPHPPRLRDDLVGTLTATSGCKGGRGHRLTAVLLATTRSHPRVTSALRERYATAQRDGISGCLHRAEERGELDGSRTERLLEPGRLEITAAIALMVQQPLCDDRPLGPEDIERIVDQVLMPLITPAHLTR
ncbi:TetR/AcrR family transcriptional regulator [Streptomyces sp. NPDC101234]|uniref:TetR/AcrR family transcriptional regulator n=1 Tax=Streptomyces sp. NPDC101234 TaxID=3366138 RepID=UPI003829AAC0